MRDKQTLAWSRSRVYVRPSRVGNWVVKRISTGSCEEHNFALVSTLTECKEAALKLRKSAEVPVRSVFGWPYCFSTPEDPVYKNTIQFDTSGIGTDRPALLTSNMQQYGLCKNGTVHTNATLVLKPP